MKKYQQRKGRVKKIREIPKWNVNNKTKQDDHKVKEYSRWGDRSSVCRPILYRFIMIGTCMDVINTPRGSLSHPRE